MPELSLDYERLAAEIVKQMNIQARDADVLWSSKDCAKYLNVSMRYLRENVAKRNDFPRNRGKGRLLFLRSEVIRWAKSAR